MSWQKWTLIAMFAFSALSNVAQLDKRRTPNPKMQAVGLIVSALLIWLVVTS